MQYAVCVGISQAPQAAIGPSLKSGSYQLAAVFDVILATDLTQLNSAVSELRKLTKTEFSSWQNVHSESISVTAFFLYSRTMQTPTTTTTPTAATTTMSVIVVVVVAELLKLCMYLWWCDNFFGVGV